MKNNKWIWRTLTILLTLVVLIGVAGAGFRLGAMRGANLTRNTDGTIEKLAPNGPMRGFENNFNHPQGRDPRMMQGFDNHGFGRDGFHSPLFTLLHLILLSLLIGLGYKFIKSSGWRITRVAPQVPAASEAPSVDEKKE